MRRFTETSKWDDPWFRQLPGVHKLVFIYVTERCNNAGFWEVDEDALCWHTKVDPKLLQGAWKGLGRGLEGASGWVWVRRFLRHQKNDDLNPENPAHKQIIGLIRDQSERFGGCAAFIAFIAPYKGLLSPIGIGKVKVQEKAPRASFRKPTLEECVAYGGEIKFPADGVKSWYDHFESNGWRVGGRTTMVDWRAGMRNGRGRKFKPNGESPLSRMRDTSNDEP